MTTVGGKVYDSVGAEAAGLAVRAYRRDTGALIGEHTTGEGIPDNPLQSFVVFHCHFNGADGATTATDVSGNSHTIAFNGSAQLDTDWGAFGSVSALKTGPSSNATVASNAMFGPVTGNFEVFAAFRSTNYSSPGNQDLFNIGSFASGILIRTASGGVTLYVNGASNTWTYSLSSNTDYYLRLYRVAGMIYLSIDGSLVGSPWSQSASIPAGALTIGTSQHNGGSEYINGWVDEVRLMIGAAEGNSTVSAELPDINDFAAVTDGQYLIDCGPYSGEVQVVCLDDGGGALENDLILRTYPV